MVFDRRNMNAFDSARSSADLAILICVAARPSHADPYPAKPGQPPVVSPQDSGSGLFLSAFGDE
jgi:hypothetical protein